MHRRIWLVVLVAVGVLAPACGREDAPDPAADQAAAEKANLQPADFPSGWSSKPQESRPGEDEIEQEVAACLGISPPATRASAKARSLDFSSGLATQASSIITVVKSEKEALADAAAFASEKFPSCAEPGFTKQIQQVAPEGAVVNNVEVAGTDFPTFGDRTVAYRVTAALQVGEMPIPINIDLVRIFKDRFEVYLTFINPGEPFPPELMRSLAGKVAGRL